MERDQATRFVHDLLRLLHSKKGSDLFLTAEFPPAFKIDGRVLPVSNQPLTSQHTSELVRAIMNDRQASEFEKTKECNFAINPTGIGRFRVSAFVQQGKVGIVFRTIADHDPDHRRTEPAESDQRTGDGQARHHHRGGRDRLGQVDLAGGDGRLPQREFSNGHIITIEDPIEYVHPHKNCIITQREVGVDCETWQVALKNTLRQAPDVILIGEVRERETMEHAIAFAETGHLVMCTLHANSTNQALDRIINFFPEEKRAQLLMDLSLNLRAMVSQRLIPFKDRKGRIPAVEIMINSPLISDLVFKGEVHEIKEVMKRSREQGMQTFDQSLFDLHEREQISYEDALRNADSVNDLRLQIKLNSKLSGGVAGIHKGIEHLGLAG